MKNKRTDIPRDSSDIKMITRKSYDQLYTKTLGNLHKMDIVIKDRNHQCSLKSKQISQIALYLSTMKL